MSKVVTVRRFGIIVRQLRGLSGRSQQSFANRLGISIRAVVNYEKDRRPSAVAMARMAHFAAELKHFELAEMIWHELPPELWDRPVTKPSPL